MEENLMIFSNKQRPNLKKLSRGLNLRRCSNMVHLNLYSIFQDSSHHLIETGFWADLRRGSNALNSDLGKICQKIGIKLNVFEFLILKLSLFFFSFKNMMQEKSSNLL